MAPRPYRNIPTNPVYGPHAPIPQLRPGLRPYRSLNPRPMYGPPAPPLRPGVRPYRNINPGGMRPMKKVTRTAGRAAETTSDAKSGIFKFIERHPKMVKYGAIGAGALAIGTLMNRATNRSSGSNGLMPRSSGGSSLYGY